MEHTTVRNNKDTDGILKFEKQEVASGLLESKERERESNQTLKMYKMEKNNCKINSLKKRKQRRMLSHIKN